MNFTMLLVLCFGYICMASGNDKHDFLKKITSSCKSFLLDSKGDVQLCVDTIQDRLQDELEDNLQKYHSDRAQLRSKMKKTVCCSNYGVLDCLASAVKSSDKCSTKEQSVIEDTEGDSLRSASFTIDGRKEVVDCTKFDKTICYISLPL